MSSTTLDPRSPATLEAADDALTEARSVERAASERVDFSREERVAGRVSIGDLHRARRALAKAQEATAAAEARVRLVRREAAALQASGAAERERERGRIRSELAAERSALEGQFAAWLERVDRESVGWDAALAAFIGRAQSHGVAGGTRPSDVRPWQSFAGGLSALRGLWRERR